MSFRWRLFLFLTLAVLAGALIDAIRDYRELQESYQVNVDTALDNVELFARVAIDINQKPPVLRHMNVAIPPGGSFRLHEQGQAVLEWPSLNTESKLKTRTVELDNYTLEVAVNTKLFRQQINAELRKDLTDDGMQVTISVFIAWLLSNFLLRPVRVLNKAINEVSQQRFPAPIPVRNENDDLSQLATSFNRMSNNIQAAIDREKVFTRYVSHELRTPLSAMRLQLEALAMGLSSKEQVLPVMERNLDRMQRVLEALLSLARSKEKHHDPISLLLIVKESIQLLPKDSQSRVILKSQISPNLKVPQPYLMGQCVLNLVDNAIKYTKGQVMVSLEPFETNVRVRVEDQGEGVPEELLDKLTHTFFRLANHVEGSGLGLAFVKHMVRTFGGDLHLRNTGTGLEVILTLPTAS